MNVFVQLPPGTKAVLAVLSMGILLACAGPGTRAGSGKPAGARHPAAAGTALPVLRREDALWLERVTFGLDSSSVADYHRVGRERFLEHQLAARDTDLPAAIAAQIAALEVSSADPVKWLAEVNGRNKALKAMADGPDKEQARKNLNEHGNKLAYESIRRELLRAVYSPAQLQEQMVWFWLNHFSVHQNKANLRWLVGDYAERAIRPNALGHFRDLVLATLEHPAMLQYLDNNQNAVGHINENYARELMELHTLGVGAHYTQNDVQQLARVLTGVGINVGTAPKLKAEWQRLYVHAGAFEFNPARHDFGTKTLLGHTIEGGGFGEVEAAVALIVRQPACARFISRELATYFVADDPSPQLVERMAQTFIHTDGDIARVLHTMFLAREFNAALGGKFKDPMRFVVSAVRFAYDGRPIDNTRPMLNWLSGLGEAPFGRQTPDGYPLTEINWASSGQMSRRFEIARAIGAGNAGLFDPEDGSPVIASGFPRLSNRLYFEAVEPFLAVPTRDALDHSNSQQEWNTFLLSSPDFSYE
ncbi:MAG: hypothetical protein JWN43_2050 [Gammaproteobacteria bacterium]|nr:hypothetical protein [Gammaproteobacteria bacterium]